MKPLELIETVYRTLGLDPELRKSPSRERPIVDARFLSAWFLDANLALPTGEISKLLHRDGAAIRKGILRVADLVPRDRQMKDKFFAVRKALYGKG